MKYQEMTEKMDFMYDIDATTTRGLALGIAKSVMNEGVSLFASFAMLLNLAVKLCGFLYGSFDFSSNC